MDTPRTVAAVVVTYNRVVKLQKCLDAILAQEGATCDAVLVVDNGSTDSTADSLENYASKGVVRLDIGFNSGSAGGFHLGVYEATMRGYDLIWAMDDDVVPRTDALKALLDADDALNGEWGFLSSIALWTDGKLCKPNLQKKGLFTFVSEEDYKRPLTEVKIAAMASLMLRSSIVREVGLPIAEYFFYTDDYEYTERVSRKYKSYLVSASVVTHEMGQNSKPNLAIDSEDRLWRYEYLYRNDVHFYRRLGLEGVAYLAVKAGYTIANILINGKNKRLKRMATLLQAYLEGARFRPTITLISSDEENSAHRT